MIYGLLGRKLGHSYSPRIHAALGNPDYKLIELEPDELAKFMRRKDIGGLNVTIPYKIDIMQYCDVISPEASAIGAVNTVVQRGGKLYGYNTDKNGLEHLICRAGIEIAGRKVLVLGSGGASRTACYCARELGAAEVVVISRSGENNYSNLSRHADAGVVINTTPVGMYPDNGSAPLTLDAFPNCEGVIDVVYNPLRTALIIEAERRGIKCAGGIAMLTAQAAAAAELFFEREVPAAEVDAITRDIVRDSTNIVLVGMPGGGKSTVGAILGELTGREVLEADALIESAAGRSIPTIFAESGEDEFRRIESDVLRSAGARAGCIIVTGGGAVTRPENYAHLHQNGRIYEIVRDIELLATNGRPLSTDIDKLREMKKVRAPMYEAFRDTRILNAGPAEETAERIWRDFCENSCY